MKCYPLVLLLSANVAFAHADNHRMQPDKSIVANETVLAFTTASELAVSPESNSPTAIDVIAVYASNVTAPEPINGMPPQHKFDGVDFTSPGPQQSFEDTFHRSLPSRDSFEVPSHLRGSLSSFSPPPGKAARSGKDILVAIAFAAVLVVGLKTFSSGAWHGKAVTEDQQGHHRHQNPLKTKSKIKSAKAAAVPSVKEADECIEDLNLIQFDVL